MTVSIGFAVIYRWRLRAGMEQQFQQQWSVSTQRILRDEGGLGSRLHQAEDGSWVGYAQWPDRATWEHARSLPSTDPEGRQRFLDAIEESFPPILLTPVADFLVPADIGEEKSGK
jgi:quinol monooxygenase YgiN